MGRSWLPSLRHWQVPWLAVLEDHPDLGPLVASVRTAPSLAFISQRDRDQARAYIQRHNGLTTPVSWGPRI